MISIIIVDDHKLIREGLKQLIEFNEDMTVIAEYSNGIDYLKEIDNNIADIILLDINMVLRFWTRLSSIIRIRRLLFLLSIMRSNILLRQESTKQRDIFLRMQALKS